MNLVALASLAAQVTSPCAKPFGIKSSWKLWWGYDWERGGLQHCLVQGQIGLHMLMNSWIIEDTYIGLHMLMNSWIIEETYLGSVWGIRLESRKELRNMLWHSCSCVHVVCSPTILNLSLSLKCKRDNMSQV